MTRTFARPARPSRLHRFSMLVATALLAMPASAAAQNLLANPNFDTTINDWPPENAGSVAFDATLDANGAPGSGSLRWTFTVGASPSDVVIASQCVTGIVPGTAYDVSGAFRLETMEAGSSANIVAFFGDAGCNPLLTPPEAAAPINAAVGCCAWNTASLTVVAPPTAGSLTIGLTAGSVPFGPGTLGGPPTTVPGQYAVNVDNLNVSATPIVPTMGPLWLAALATLLLYVAWSRRQRATGATA